MFTVLGILAFAVLDAEAADVFSPDPAAVQRLAKVLPPMPDGLGPRISDRKAWESIARRREARDAVAHAETLMGKPLPEVTDDLYLDFSRTGNRKRCETVIYERRSRIPILALAACVEGKGRFLPELEKVIRAICAEKSWVLPAHDGNLQTFTGKLITIDLVSSALGWTLGTVDYLLGERLSPEVRTLIRTELDRRIFQPYKRMCAGQQSQQWLLVRNNWNHVCLAGVTGAALTALTNPAERAWYVLAAEHYARYGLEGFTPDGYCDEGVGYWNYGFAHYAVLAETVRRATKGAVDLMNRKDAVMPSAYGFQIELVPGVSPSFADCDVSAAPRQGLLDYLSRRYLGRPRLRQRTTIAGGLCDQVMALFPEDAPVVRTETPWPKFDPLRAWFPDHSVYIGRPGRGSSSRLSVALMGGHNAQNHNHNDVGVFMVVVGKVPVLPDIGAEVYTRRTFSPQRYESRALNSWGHAVPLIAGQLQKSGRDAAARVLTTEFNRDSDRIVLDIRAAYPVDELKKLERSYLYERTGTGRFVVTDTFAFDKPAAYETALLTFGTWEKADDRTLIIRDGGEAVRVHLNTPGPADVLPVIVAEEVNEDLTARRKATRIGIRLPEPIQQGSVTMTIVPEPPEKKP